MELKLGNKIYSIDHWVWSEVPFQVYMKHPLHSKEAEKIMDPQKTAYRFDKSGPWISAEQRYICKTSNDFIEYIKKL